MGAAAAEREGVGAVIIWLQLGQGPDLPAFSSATLSAKPHALQLNSIMFDSEFVHAFIGVSGMG